MTKKNTKRKKNRFLQGFLAAAVTLSVGAFCIVVAVVTHNFIGKPTVSVSSAASAVSSVSSAGLSADISSQDAGASSAASSAQASGTDVSGADSSSVSSSVKTGKPASIDVSIAEQRVRVYDAKHNLLKTFVCSTGLPGHDTPTGTFHIVNRGKSFFSEKYQEGGYYWLRFEGSYLFHSVPFDKNYKMIASEAEKLGQKASHGCVRLATTDEKWMYENILTGTKVTIH